MALTEVRLPALGEGIIEATITRWLVKPGEKVGTETPLVEIATDKVDTEVFSPVEGIVAEILLPEQSVPKIGQVLLRIFSESEEEKNGSPEVEPFTPVTETVTVQQHSTAILTEKQPVKKPDRRFISPFVRYLATSEGITPDELYNIPGTGNDGQLTRDDILNYVLNALPKTDIIKPNGYDTERKEVIHTPAEIIAGPNETVVPMDRVRKLIARNMIESKRIAPHVTVFSEVDVTPIVNWRNKVKTKFREKYNENLTFTPIFIEAVAKALRDFPGINISVKEDFIIHKNAINISMAVALPDGNLIVPVVNNADILNLPELSRQVNDLSHRARNGKLKPVEIQEGTFTITNIGSFGNISGTPIINQPQVAILAIGTIIKKPAAVNVNGTLGIGLRDITTLSLSFDHRAVDGAMGGMFLQRICEYLLNFDSNRDI
jgi:2-oxoglutarate dehydrogenase E2 component (dihydrolipoamide succinyltransferase)